MPINDFNDDDSQFDLYGCLFGIYIFLCLIVLILSLILPLIISLIFPHLDPWEVFRTLRFWLGLPLVIIYGVYRVIQWFKDNSINK